MSVVAVVSAIQALFRGLSRAALPSLVIALSFHAVNANETAEVMPIEQQRLLSAAGQKYIDSLKFPPLAKLQEFKALQLGRRASIGPNNAVIEGMGLKQIVSDPFYMCRAERTTPFAVCGFTNHHPEYENLQTAFGEPAHVTFAVALGKMPPLKGDIGPWGLSGRVVTVTIQFKKPTKELQARATDFFARKFGFPAFLRLVPSNAAEMYSASCMAVMGKQGQKSILELSEAEQEQMAACFDEATKTSGKQLAAGSYSIAEWVDYERLNAVSVTSRLDAAPDAQGKGELVVGHVDVKLVFNDTSAKSEWMQAVAEIKTKWKLDAKYNAGKRGQGLN